MFEAQYKSVHVIDFYCAKTQSCTITLLLLINTEAPQKGVFAFQTIDIFNKIGYIESRS